MLLHHCEEYQVAQVTFKMARNSEVTQNRPPDLNERGGHTQEGWQGGVQKIKKKKLTGM